MYINSGFNPFFLVNLSHLILFLKVSVHGFFLIGYKHIFSIAKNDRYTNEGWARGL